MFPPPPSSLKESLARGNSYDQIAHLRVLLLSASDLAMACCIFVYICSTLCFLGQERAPDDLQPKNNPLYDLFRSSQGTHLSMATNKLLHQSLGMKLPLRTHESQKEGSRIYLLRNGLEWMPPCVLNPHECTQISFGIYARW